MPSWKPSCGEFCLSADGFPPWRGFLLLPLLFIFLFLKVEGVPNILLLSICNFNSVECRELTLHINYFKFYWNLFYGPVYEMFWWVFHNYFKRMYILLLLVVVLLVLYMSIKSSWSIVLIALVIFCVFFPLTVRGALKSLAIIAKLSNFFKSINFASCIYVPSY